MNRVEALLADGPSAAEFADRYLGYLSDVLARIDRQQVAAFIQVLLNARRIGARIFFLGNGGSAATASHFVNDITIGTRATAPPFRACSLADNYSTMTAIANDFGYDQVFSRQLETQLNGGDVVVAISASGNSHNILEAVRFAKAHGATVVGLTGFDGGALKELADISVHVPAGQGEYGPVEDGHMILDHVVSTFLCYAVRSAPAVFQTKSVASSPGA
jgi:D-sedoheptulose 7-phosphate isomerase